MFVIIRLNNDFSCVHYNIKNEITFYAAFNKFTCVIFHFYYIFFNFLLLITIKAYFNDFLKILFNCFKFKTYKSVIFRFYVILSELKSFLLSFK